VGKGLDYSAGTIHGATIKADGYDFVCRYVDDPNINFSTKHIDPNEMDDLLAAGVQVMLVFEVNTQDWTGGFLEGVVHGTRAKAGADWVGYEGVIFAAVDTNTEQVPVALEYLQGFQNVLGHDRTGVYGFVELIQAAQAAGVGTCYWQCGHPPAPGAGVHIWQVQPPAGNTVVGGIACDINELLLPLPSEDDLLTDEEHAMLVACYQQLSGSTTVGDWPGWPTWPGGTGENLSLLDYLRRNNVSVKEVQDTLNSFSVGEAGDFGALSQDDVNRIAQAVVALLYSKLSSQ
jgi:hypothetical protein